MHTRFFSVAAGAALVLLCATAVCAAPPPSFAYDSTAPLDLSVESTTQDGKVRIDRIAYRAQDQIVEATLVSPTDPSDAMPGVLFVRGPGDAQTGDDPVFLEDAKWLARRGAVSLIPDVPWAAPDWFAKGRAYETDARDTIANVIALRRGFDALAETFGVDKKRLAYVGHGLGATYGALFRGVDLRAALAVFMAPDLSLAARLRAGSALPPPDAAAYAATLAPFDTRSALARSSFTASLLQFAKRDGLVPKSDADAFANAVPGTDRTVAVYDTDDALETDEPTDERRAWLAKKLFRP